MTTLTIEIPDKKADLAKMILKELGATVIVIKEKERIPNAQTIKAMKELKAGKGKAFNSSKELFASL